MENKGAKIAVVIFMILAIIAFAFGTILGVSMLNDTSNAETAQEQAGQALVTIVFMAPFLLSYLLFALFDIIGFFISIHLIRNDAKGLGIFNLLLGFILVAVAVFISLKLLVF